MGRGHELREAKVTNSNVDSRRMEEYVYKTEARNVELEATVRTLQRQICLLENEVSNLVANHPASGDKFNSSTNHADPPLLINGSSNQHSADRSNNAYTKETNDIVFGIQQQVTRIVLNKVSQQINRVELMDQEQHTTQIFDPIWPTSSRTAEKLSPSNLHVPSNQQRSQTVTHASIGEPWSVYAPRNPAAQFQTSSGGKPAVRTHLDQDPHASLMMPRTEP